MAKRRVEEETSIGFEGGRLVRKRKVTIEVTGEGGEERGKGEVKKGEERKEKIISPQLEDAYGAVKAGIYGRLTEDAGGQGHLAAPLPGVVGVMGGEDTAQNSLERIIQHYQNPEAAYQAITSRFLVDLAEEGVEVDPVKLSSAKASINAALRNIQFGGIKTAKPFSAKGKSI
ncbi:hypothetical protein A2Z22_03740 [Candidatus Woesebacteria bacterium RBG_16_34_12]|uniref:Uncharacterized protein n=1 Tax=Candidatus Woesebacteria bacterium RBG_16_34_12 TaxID=1802480 RepID=A0A1F7X785_9BACT|nr:MAG: hypothetical protein A2Z22_03740 [Candidatus Woesebacteria bacterium RBG_16_34_12]